MKKLLYVIFISTFFVSCISIPKKSYVYLTLEPKLTFSNSKNINISIRDIEIFPPYNTKYIYYSYRNYEVQPYLYHLWSAPLKNMILNILVYNNRGIKFNREELGGSIKYRIKMVIKRFLHVFRKDSSYVLIDMNIFLFNNNKLIGVKEYNVKRKCMENTPYGAVSAFNKGISFIFDDFQKWILTEVEFR